MSFELNDNVNVERDEEGNVQHLDHLQQPFVAGGADGVAEDEGGAAPANTPQGLAAQYLRAVAPVYGISEDMLPDQSGADSLTVEDSTNAGAPSEKLELAEEKDLMGTATVSYQQTYRGLPVWEAGVSVTIQPEPLRVTASQSSVHQDVSLPPADSFEGGFRYAPDNITPDVLSHLLGLNHLDEPTPASLKEANSTWFKINDANPLVYRFDPEARFDPAARVARGEALQEPPPTLPLPPLPDTFVNNKHYEVIEVLFTLPVGDFGPLNWRAFVEVNTGAVLYLRAFVACATGMIFKTDPLTAGAAGSVLPTSAVAALNPFRSTVALEGLVNGNPQSLGGQFVRLVDNGPPSITPPTRPNPPSNFSFDATSREFAAVNAYHHCDWLFRHMQGMGFDLTRYFDGTTFPVPVDACAFSDQRNARAPGNATGRGSDGFQFGLAGLPFPAVSIAGDLRVVLHEFGHTLLWDSVHSPNFGFAHSAGDSLAAIFMDPESVLRNDPARRFDTFPWVIGNRNHGRRVEDGWGWDGERYAPFVPFGGDEAGYVAEQILSTTLFRVYRSMGGDSNAVARRRLASRQAIYLIFRAIGSLASNPVTRTPRPEVFATALVNADIGTRDFEGYKGGALHKVIRWGFEKQGLYQPPGSPRPVTTAGAAPAVDVYIDDGRNGEYQFQPAHWESKEVWNRQSSGAGDGVHQTPVVGQPNFAYVRVRNRGSQHANNVVVRGYSSSAGVGHSWPGDWTPMDTPQLNVAGGVPPGGSVVVGPFRWTPRNVGNESMLMEVSADGDLSNIDPRTFYPCASGPTPDWQLVPFDNNLGQRNVAPVAGGGGLRGLLTSFLGRSFLVRNPSDRQARMEVKAELPRLLAERGWRVRLDNREEVATFDLAPGISRPVTVSLSPGARFSREELSGEDGAAVIRMVTYADGVPIGGITYQLDPDLSRAPIERRGDRPTSLNDPRIAGAILEAGLAEELETASLDADARAGQGEETEAAVQLLSQLGVTDEQVGRVNRVRMRKIILEIELGDD